MKRFLVFVNLIFSVLIMLIIFGCNSGENNSDLQKCSSDKDCIKTGCSATLCQPAKQLPSFTTCEYRPEYECYKNIACGCENSKCQWKADNAFWDCFEEKRKMDLIPLS